MSWQEELEAGGTLVVPTRFRASAIEIAWARNQLENGRTAWRTPDVMAYPAWLEREAWRATDAGRPSPRPLRAAEEWLLWREATAAAARSEGFEASDGLSERLQRAARTLHEWDIAPAALRSSGRAESRLLARALASVEAHARDLNAAPAHRLAASLRGFPAASPVTFAGFVEQSAARRALVRAWSEPAGRRGELEPSDGFLEPGDVPGVAASDAQEEIECAAEWCRSRLMDDPGAHLLLIVPSLAERRAQIVQVLRRVLAPRELLCGAADIPGLVAAEGSMPLAAEPIVRHALATLEFLAGRAEAEAVSAWLRAAFWSGPTAVERAAMDIVLRERVGVEVTPGALRAALLTVPEPHRERAERLARVLEAAQETLRAAGATGASASAPLSEWARRFERTLRVIGWPAGPGLDEREGQGAAQFREVLEDLAAFGVPMGAVTGGEALRTLRALAARRALRLPPRDAAVTVCGALIDPIIRYDGLWLAGMHAEACPPPAGLDPFIPAAAQRRAGIPSATPALRLAQARELLRRCRLAGGRLVASWPMRGSDGEHLPSPLLAEWGVRIDEPGARAEAPRDNGPASRTESLARSIRASRRIETFEDRRGEPWPARRPLPAGSRAIEYQSRCAFRAYAELRLACAPLGAPRPGIGALDRGRLLHRALELVWSELGGFYALEEASRSGTLAPLIEAAVNRAGAETLAAPTDAVERATQRRERRRCVRLLGELAALERRRPPFRVRATERPCRIEIEGATLEVRIDRIDELEGGRLALFDYKTGRTGSVDWLAERIGNPQLLVYSLAVEQPPAALAMIQLAPPRVAYRGMAERRGLLPKVEAPPDTAPWRDQLGRWREVVGGLVRDFLAGAAATDPLGDACAACHLQAFCRIAELAPSAAAEADPASEGGIRD